VRSSPAGACKDEDDDSAGGRRERIPFATASPPTPHVVSARTHASVDESASLRSEGSPAPHDPSSRRWLRRIQSTHPGYRGDGGDPAAAGTIATHAVSYADGVGASPLRSRSLIAAALSSCLLPRSSTPAACEPVRRARGCTDS
jgi:hypothetical protein